MTSVVEYKRNWHKANPTKGAQYKKDFIERSPEVYLLYNPKARAKKNGWEFDLTPEDIVIPSHCPVLGVKLTPPGTNGKDNNYGPSVHRVDPTKGYVKGNVMIVSWRANDLIKDGSLEEFKRITKFLKKTEKDS